jgi:XTP/dITP diphosphohydrolase
MRLIYGSTNIDKLAEVIRVGSCHGVAIVNLRQAADITGKGSPPEIGEPHVCYDRNATLKASAYARWFDQPCMADDTGIEIDALGDLPGVYAGRFGVRRVRQLLIPGVAYPARFVCCVAYGEPSGRLVSVTAHLPGAICFPRDAEIPSSGIPYSYFFTPIGQRDNLVATLSADTNFLSHRGLAFSRLLKSLTFPEAGRG